MGEIVPFGKYKGQPAARLAADTDYCDWLTAQPWFASKYGNIYNIVISGGGEPQDSPEHNEMQARFLDDDWCLRLAALLTGRDLSEAAPVGELEASELYREFQACVTQQTTPASIRSRQFEAAGWDVTYQPVAGTVSARVASLASLPSCTCRCDHAECGEDSECNGGTGRPSSPLTETCGGYYCRHRHHDPRKNWASEDGHCTAGCPWGSGGAMRAAASDPDREQWHGRWSTKAGWLKYGIETGHGYGGDWLPHVYVELKPDLGDDYPAVLRQVTGYRCQFSDGPYRCVITRRHAFQHVTWDQVRQIYAASHVTLLAESELAAEPMSAAERALRAAGMLADPEEASTP